MSSDPTWNSFLNKLSQIDNQFLSSIISQAEFLKFDTEKKLVEIGLSNNNAFIRDTINENKKEWLPILKELYKGVINFEFIKKKHQITGKAIIKAVQTEQIIKKASPPKTNTITPRNPAAQKTAYSYRSFSNKSYSQKPKFNPTIDVSDKEKWPKANLIKDIFPGKVKKQQG